MTQRLELELMRRIKSAKDSGDARGALEYMRQLRDVKQGVVAPEATPMERLGRGFYDIGQGVDSLVRDSADWFTQTFPDAAATAGNVLAGFGVTDQGTADRFSKLAAEGTAGGVVQLENDAVRRDRAAEVQSYEEANPGFDPYRLGGNILATALIPGGVQGNALTRMGTAALSGAGIGGVMPADSWSERGLNMLAGGAGGAAGSAVVSGVGKGINAFRGRMGNASVQQAGELSDKFGVNLTAGDAAGGAILPKAETSLESIPIIGMGRIRERQMNQAKSAASRLLSRTGDTGQDIGETVQKSAMREFQTRRDIATEMFNEIRDVADDYGVIPLTNMSRVAQNQIDRLNRILESNPGQAKAIQAKIDALAPYADAGQMTYSEIREITRANLVDLIDSMYAPGAVIGKKGVGDFEKLRRALEDDLENGLKEIGGETWEKYLKAKKWYQANVVPYKKGQGVGISTVLDTSEPERILSRWVKGGKKDKAAALYDSLNDEGKEAVRVGIIREAWEAATSGPNSQNGVFSPAAFASEINKYKDAIPTFFRGDAKAEIDGFTRLMQHIKRAGQYMENPSTGARLLTPLLFAGAAGVGATTSPMITGAAVTGGALLTSLLSSKIGRNSLLAASNVEVGSKGMQAIVDQLTRQLTRSGSIGAVQSTNSTPRHTQDRQRSNLLAQ